MESRMMAHFLPHYLPSKLSGSEVRGFDDVKSRHFICPGTSEAIRNVIEKFLPSREVRTSHQCTNSKGHTGPQVPAHDDVNVDFGLALVPNLLLPRDVSSISGRLLLSFRITIFSLLTRSPYGVLNTHP